jgi:hypothetical protein
MRRKPVTRDEIRFNGSRITTLPIDSVREGEYHPEPIKAYGHRCCTRSTVHRRKIGTAGSAFAKTSPGQAGAVVSRHRNQSPC